jgi:hypothetical protein
MVLFLSILALPMLHGATGHAFELFCEYYSHDSPSIVTQSAHAIVNVQLSWSVAVNVV